MKLLILAKIIICGRYFYNNDKDQLSTLVLVMNTDNAMKIENYRMELKEINDDQNYLQKIEEIKFKLKNYVPWNCSKEEFEKLISINQKLYYIKYIFDTTKTYRLFLINESNNSVISSDLIDFYKEKNKNKFHLFIDKEDNEIKSDLTEKEVEINEPNIHIVSNKNKNSDNPSENETKEIKKLENEKSKFEGDIQKLKNDEKDLNSEIKNSIESHADIKEENSNVKIQEGEKLVIDNIKEDVKVKKRSIFQKIQRKFLNHLQLNLKVAIHQV